MTDQVFNDRHVNVAYARLLDKAPVAMFAVDKSGQVLFANDRLHQLLGYAAGQLTSLPTNKWILAGMECFQGRKPALDSITVPGAEYSDVQLRQADGSTQRLKVHWVEDEQGIRLATVQTVSDWKMPYDVDASRLEAIVSSSDDAIIGKDLDSVITNWNHGAEVIFGYRPEEMIGESILRLIPPERHSEELRILDRIRNGERIVGLETERLTRDGKRIEVSITVSPIRNSRGQIVGASKIARDVTAAKANLRELDRTCRLYAALSQVNQAIVWTRGRQQLFDRTCRALIEQGGFQLAWIGWHNRKTQQLEPIAVWGEHAVYVKEIQVYGGDQPQGQGPSGKAFREGVQFVCNDLLNEPSTKPWHDALRRYGFLSSAAFPLKENGQVVGILSVYAGEPNFFQSKELALLQEAAGDVSFALDNLAMDEARRAAESLAESERNFSETMIESTPGILYFYNRDGKFLRWNKNFESVTGYGSDEIQNMGPLDLFSQKDKKYIESKIEEVFSSGESAVEAPLRCKGGRTIPYLFTGRRVEFNGEVCLVGMGIDISERIEAENALRRARDQLESEVATRTADLLVALSRAEAADKIKSSFLATMSHELRTPLNSIIGFTGILLQGLAGPLGEEQSKQLLMVQNSAQHLLELINDVLDISKIEAEQLELHPTRFNVHDLIERTVSSVQPMAERKKLDLKLRMADNVKEIRSDARRVEQILLNLVNNAIKFTNEGSVTVNVDLIPSTSRSQEADPQELLRVRVIDTGIGIKVKDLPILFKPFQQIDSSLTRQYEGTGLGLAICKRLASMLGGDIQVSSQWTKGSVFEFILPTGIDE